MWTLSRTLTNHWAKPTLYMVKTFCPLSRPGLLPLYALCFTQPRGSLVVKSCLILCDPINCSTPGFPVLHYLPKFAQTHVHRVSGAIQPSHPLSSASTLAPNLSQHQGLFQWVDSSCHLVKGLELQLQQQSFQRIFRVLPVELTGLISLGSPRDSQESSPALQLLKASVLWCFAFFVVQLSYPYVTPGKNKALGDLCWQSDVSAF